MIEARATGTPRVVVITATHPWGNLEVFFDPELEQLAKRVDLVLVPVWPRRPPPDPAHPALSDAAVVCHPFGPRVLGQALLQALLHPRAVLRAIRLTWNGNLRTAPRNLLAVPKALWLARCLRTWQIDHMHAYWASTPATVAMVASELTGVPWSMTAHRGDLAPQFLIPAKVERAAWVRGISQSTMALLAEANGSSVPPDRAVLIHLGVDVPPRLPRPSRPPGPHRVMCAAQLIPLKRHADLIEAVGSLVDRGMDLCLDLAGEGPEEERLRELIVRRGLADRVRLLGQIHHDHLLGRYRSGEVDLVVLASEVEGIPVSLMEAMAAEVAVLATDVGGIRELLDGGGGVVVPAGDVSALADGIARVLTDAALRQQLVDVARRRIETEFDARVTAQRLAERLISG